MTRHLLQRAGLWPTECPTCESERFAPDANLLPLLEGVWRQLGRRGGSTACQAARTTADRIRQLYDRGAALTIGVGRMPSGAADWIGERIAWWPEGIPAQRRVALLSSHLGREGDSRGVWFTALRAACTKVNAADDLLVTTATVTTDRFVRRCHELFEIPLLDVRLPKRASNLSNWGPSILQQAPRRGNSAVYRLLLSPDQEIADKTKGIAGPLADRAIIALSERLIVLSLNQRGRLLPLIKRRVGDRQADVPSVSLAIGADLIPSKIAQPLLDRGAVGWILLDTLPTRPNLPPADTGPDRHLIRRATAAPIIPIPSAQRWPYLTHWTRHRVGPWPGQQEREYLDDLILQRQDADHSPLATLQRILRQRRIAASSQAIRGAVCVVSFTSLPLNQFPSMRVFRRHRGRWDFEPYGICIRRDWLEDQGARPVIYGDEAVWHQLSEADRPFFQRKTSGAGQEAKIHWTREREWRLIGSVDLSTVPEDAALVFVPTSDEANLLVDQSPWPIVVLAQDRK